MRIAHNFGIMIKQYEATFLFQHCLLQSVSERIPAGLICIPLVAAHLILMDIVLTAAWLGSSFISLLAAKRFALIGSYGFFNKIPAQGFELKGRL